MNLDSYGNPVSDEDVAEAVAAANRQGFVGKLEDELAGRLATGSFDETYRVAVFVENPSLGYNLQGGLLRAGPERVIQNVKVLGVCEVVLPQPCGPDQIYIEDQINTDTTSGHGTAVAGLVAGTGAVGNGIYKGAAPQATIVGLGAGETLLIFHVVGSYNYILSHQTQYSIRIVNNSYGTSHDDMPYRDPNHPINVATRVAHSRGITSFFSAGNSGPGNPEINPLSEWPWVISVDTPSPNHSVNARASSSGLIGHPLERRVNGRTPLRPLLLADLVLQPHEAVEQCLRPRRTTRHVNIHRQQLVYPLQYRVAPVHPARGSARAHRDYPFGVRHLVPEHLDCGSHLLGDGPSHDHNVRLARGGAEDAGPEAVQPACPRWAGGAEIRRSGTVGDVGASLVRRCRRPGRYLVTVLRSRRAARSSLPGRSACRRSGHPDQVKNSARPVSTE